MTSRRDLFRYAAAGAALALHPRALLARDGGELIQRAIPSSGETLPIIGLGSSATFRRMADDENVDRLRAVMRTLVENGGTVFDTAPGYGDSEAVAGEIVKDLGIAQKVFWATKVNAVPRGGDSAEPRAVRQQLETSFERVGLQTIDLIQVHNLQDVPTQLAVLKELQEAGRVRYIGTTSTSSRDYDYLAQVMREEPLDFIGVDYAIDNRESARTILPLAQERGIAVLAYLPFGRSRLWARTEGVELPAWAADFGARSWAQFFLKFIAAHPAITVITPATSNPKHMLDNLGGGTGPLPDAATQKRMIEFVDALPSP